LTAPGLERWLPDLLSGLDGRRSVAELLAAFDADRRAAAGQLLQRLYGERVLIDALARERHVPRRCALVVEEEGPLADGLRACVERISDASSSLTLRVGVSSGRTGNPSYDGEPNRLRVLAQDRLDYAALLDFNRRCRASRDLGLWVSTGAQQRGYVSPVIVPDAGPCLACLIGHFRRLSPAPELYDHLAEHAQAGQPIVPASFPDEGVVILQQLVLWKWSLLGQAEPPAALYRLHVLEVASLEVSARRVFADPECPVCGEAG
jgi:bacteriocin biosynthesis cyclodehydratase domain-containing protein